MCQNTIAIIPARAGSKRCPDKNIALFKGIPLIAHSIHQALASGLFDTIIVTSDDPAIIDAAQQFPVAIDHRDPNLAADNAPLIDLIRNLIVKYDLADNTLVGLLLATGPLRSIEDITKAYQLFLATDQQESVVSVTANENPVEMSWYMRQGHLDPVFNQQLTTTRKQDFKQSYRYNDAVIFDLAVNFMNPDRNLFGRSPIPYIMPPERSINIDYEFQLKLVQMMGEHYK